MDRQDFHVMQRLRSDIVEDERKLRALQKSGYPKQIERRQRMKVNREKELAVYLADAKKFIAGIESEPLRGVLTARYIDNLSWEEVDCKLRGYGRGSWSQGIAHRFWDLNRPPVETDIEKLRKYLESYKLCTICIDSLLAEQSSLSEDHPAPAALQERLDKTIEQNLIRKIQVTDLISKLSSAKDRTFLTMRYIEGLTNKQLAARMNQTEGSVYNSVGSAVYAILREGLWPIRE